MNSNSSGSFFCEKLTSDKGVALVELVLVFTLLMGAIIGFFTLILPQTDRGIEREMIQMGSLDGSSRYQLALGLVFSDGSLAPVPVEEARVEIKRLVQYLERISRGENACAFRAVINAEPQIDVVVDSSCVVPTAVKDLAVSLISPSNPIVAFAFFANNPKVATQVEVTYSHVKVSVAEVMTVDQGAAW